MRKNFRDPANKNFRETGIIYSKHFSPKEYKTTASQNWGGLQDNFGVIFFCNGDGVLSYDGKTWSLTETPTQSVVRSMAIDSEGKIFVGALDDFGYLDRSPNGKYRFVSLLDKVNPDLYGMGNIWKTFTHSNLTYFEAESGLFTWDGQRIVFFQWPDKTSFHKSFLWNNEVYVNEEGRGLLKFENDKFILAPAGDFFKTKRIYGALDFSENEVLLASRYNGLFTYDGNNIKAFKTEADAFFKKHQIYTALMLPDSTMAFGTRIGGVVIIDKKGLIRYMFNKENQLSSNTALGLISDHQNNLWITLENGVSRFEIHNHISLYNLSNGLEGSPNSIARYNENLYAATNAGLYVLRPSNYPDYPSHFEKIENVNIRCWNLLQISDRLLVTSDEGIYEVNGSKVAKVTDIPSHALHALKADSLKVLVAVDGALMFMELKGGKWRRGKFINDIALDNISFNESQPGKIWLGTFSQGVALLTFFENSGTVDYDSVSVQFFGSKDGLPEGFIKMNTIDNHEIFRVGTESKIFRFDYSLRRFLPDTLFARVYGLQNDGIFPITNKSKTGELLFKTRKAINNRRQLILVNQTSEDSFSNTTFDISRIFENVHVTSLVEDNIVWQAGSDGIARYEMTTDQSKDSTRFRTYLNKIFLMGDSIFFQGVGVRQQGVNFPYVSNSLRFEFTSTNFVAEEANQFQYKLEGFDKDWSEWSTESVKEYANLWEGNYKFLVRSRNLADQKGSADEFSFRISPPWFRSVYAYIVYFIGAVVFVWGLVRLRLQSILREKEALQREVSKQTEEIRQQNIQLAEQSEELKVNAEQLKALDKMKSNFFVNISHEFRTPLSLILSPLEKFVQQRESALLRFPELERMHRNAKRLQQLINQLLDLAKLESGSMKLNSRQSDFVYFIRVLVSSFESLAESRNIQFDVDIRSESYETCFDHEKVETVLYNLLSNAFKFTPDGGRISVCLMLSKENGHESILFSVKDTGPGIPASEVDKIFDRFYQIDSSSSREYEGSGIGLSLVKELVQLMKGTVSVKSEPAKGTTFTVHLPLHRLANIVDKALVDSKIRRNAGEPLSSAAESEVSEEKILNENSPGAEESLILLVEDNADLRSYLKENLEEEYQVAVAENGTKGLELAIELIPDLILSDMMMPEMDGFTLCTRIREDERTSHIPFVLLTARATIESKLEGLELGADAYMTKPFNMKEIKVRIKNLLEQRKKLRKSFSREVTVQPKNIAITSIDERFLNHALETMEAHLSDQQFSVEKFAEIMGMSRKNLLRKIKALTDQSVNEFIRNFRLQRAAQLISNKSATVSEIAYQVGFNNLSYFSKCFKELFDVLPNEYGKV